MQLTTLLLNLSVAATAFAAPLLTKRQGLVTIDGEPTDFHIAKDSRGRFIHPEDFPYYDSLPHLQCEAHINYVPRISRKAWKEECPPKILRWKIEHNVFESQESAAEGRAQVERDRQDSVNACIRSPRRWGCKKMLKEDAAIRKDRKLEEEVAAKQEKERKAKAAVAAKLEKEQREREAVEKKEREAAEERERERKRKADAKESEKVWREKAAAAKKEKAAAKQKKEEEQGGDGVEPSQSS